MIWLAALAGVAYGVLESHRLTFRHLDVRLRRLPAAFDGFSILHLSDFHLRRFGRYERTLCRWLRALSADLVALTGDYKSRAYTPTGPVVEALRRLLQCLPPEAPRLAVLGNKDTAEIVEPLARLGVRVLLDQAVPLERNGQRLWFLGTSTVAPLRRGETIRVPPEAIPRHECSILLTHSPDAVHWAAAQGIDLALAGDTHGGQIWLPLLGPVKVKSRASRRYCRGLIRHYGTQLHISSGLGCTGMPLRLLCPPEITVLTLRRT